MTELTAKELQQMEAAVTDALQAQEVAGAEAVPMGVDPKRLFCEHWDTVKAVLTYLKDLDGIPKLVKAVIGLIIKAGDKAYPKLCPR